MWDGGGRLHLLLEVGVLVAERGGGGVKRPNLVVVIAAKFESANSSDIIIVEVRLEERYKMK